MLWLVTVPVVGPIFYALGRVARPVRRLWMRPFVADIEAATDIATEPGQLATVREPERVRADAALVLAALAVVAAEHVDRAYGRYLARRDTLPEEWAEVSGANEYALDLTPAELKKLLEVIDALVRPYVRPIREDAPADSEVVHVTLRAFLETDLFLDR